MAPDSLRLAFLLTPWLSTMSLPAPGGHRGFYEDPTLPARRDATAEKRRKAKVKRQARKRSR